MDETRCQYCKKLFASKPDLDIHLFFDHRFDIQKNQKMESGLRKYFCQTCESSFHGFSKVNVCPRCGGEVKKVEKISKKV